jgi:hypothetical protein
MVRSIPVALLRDTCRMIGSFGAAGGSGMGTLLWGQRAALSERQRGRDGHALPRQVLADVYVNLNRSCLSLRSAHGPDRGRVIAYAQAVAIEQASFVVSESGRLRVLSRRVKSVHAHIRGRVTILLCDEQREPAMALARELDELARTFLIEPVRYNPYETTCFVNRFDGRPIHDAAQVVITAARVYASRRGWTAPAA